MTADHPPVPTHSRITSLDQFRGSPVVGMLLVNILNDEIRLK